MEEIMKDEVESVESDKIIKREQVRQEIINAAVSGRIDKLRDKVAYILNNFTAARNSDNDLAWIFWRTFEAELFNGETISPLEMKKLTKISSLTRVRAKIQNEYRLFQADEKVRKRRHVLDSEMRQAAVAEKPPYELYRIYIDETGKTQKYISVGSLWVTDTRESFFANNKLIEWKKDNGVDFEFHFADLKNHQLELYKIFFLKFLTLNTTVGFKIITVDKSGFSDINNTITDLTFHLIKKGIMHEHESGRAPLPRLLQVILDNEEKGSDKVKLENIEERLISQRIEGLVIDSLEVADSKNNNYLQVVDLFLSSVNRKLNSPESNGKPKDELADYILGLLDFRVGDIDTTNNDVDKCKEFNLTYKRETAIV